MKSKDILGNKQGFRIWEIQDNKVPKEIYSMSSIRGKLSKVLLKSNLDKLDLENKTYAIRIGKSGLK